MDLFDIREGFRLLNMKLSDKKVIVACCGAGLEVEYLVNAGCEVVGLDISITMLKECRTKFPKVETVLGDAELMPFRRGCFDIGLVHLALHHLPNPYEGIGEILRVTKNAVVLIDIMNPLITRLVSSLGFCKREWCGIEPNRLEMKRVHSVFEDNRAYIKNLVCHFDYLPKCMEPFLRYSLFYSLLKTIFKLQYRILKRFSFLRAQVFGNTGIIIGHHKFPATKTHA